MGLSSVDDLLTGLAHPYADDIQRLRAEILGVDPTISDGVKWNSLSFRTTEWFATLNTRATDRIEFVFHLGAKVRDKDIRDQIPDVAGRVSWRSKDRCLVSFKDAADVEANLSRFLDFVRAWIRHV